MSDLINRQDAIDAVERAKTTRAEDGEIYVAKIHAEINIYLLPSAERKRGEWEWVQYDANNEIGDYHCSECRFIPASWNLRAEHLNYCPNCGAEMRGGNNDGR